jgi:hypothetical protein
VEKGLRSNRFRGPMLVHDIAVPLLSPHVSPSHDVLISATNCIFEAASIKEDGMTARRIVRNVLGKRIPTDNVRVLFLLAHMLMKAYPEVDVPAVHVGLALISLVASRHF